MDKTVSGDLKIKVADFGFATYFKATEKENKMFGTP